MTALAWRSMQGPAQLQTRSGTLMARNKENQLVGNLQSQLVNPKGSQGSWEHSVWPQGPSPTLLPLDSKQLQHGRHQAAAGWHPT